MSVIIAAFDEEAVIGATLESVLAQDHTGPLEVIVVANGCSDDTATVASGYARAAAATGRPLHVIELATPNKPAALNAGDTAATGEVRVYLDADVTISPSAVASMVAALGGTGIEYATPRLVVEPPRHRIVRDYVTIWSSLPYVREGGAGRGVYAVSAAGRARWGEFPDVLADDSFARLHLRPSEVGIVDGSTVTVRFPETWREMVGVRERLFLGVWELRDRHGSLAANEAPHGRVALRTIAATPTLWPRAPAFVAVYAAGRRRARRSARAGDRTWYRATSSRTARRPSASAAGVSGRTRH